MAFTLGDIFIGDFPITQQFGEHPEVYSARYNLKGHNGTDFGCPSLTPVLAANDGVVIEAAFDQSGYGRYVKILHEGYFTIYGHLNDVNVAVKDKVVSGQLLGHSNNTGFSTGPHLHFGVAPCDLNGLKTEANNGFSGYIDPMGNRCEWHVKHLTEPVVPMQNTKPDVPVKSDDFVMLVTKSSNWDVIASFLQLTETEKIDPKGGEKAAGIVADIVKARTEAEAKVKELEGQLARQSDLSPTLPSDPSQTTPPGTNLAGTDQSRGVLISAISDFFDRVKGFVFVKT